MTQLATGAGLNSAEIILMIGSIPILRLRVYDVTVCMQSMIAF